MIGGMTAETKEANSVYIDAKHVTKHTLWLVKSEAEKEEFATDGDGVVSIAKQMDCKNQDIVGENCVRNDTVELALTDEDKIKAWVEHYARLLSVEYQWPNNELSGVPSTAGPHRTYLQHWFTKHSVKNATRLLAHLAS